MTIDQINFTKLKAFDGKTSASFEQMIYQLVKNQYGNQGMLTPIDGSGGDAGVEFYLTFDSGDVWGWQCKYYEDNGRLSDSGRFKKIEGSLNTACKNHPKLSKWFLCLKTDLTVDLETSTGKKKTGERSWFVRDLPSRIPAGQTVGLEFIGRSEIFSMLQKPLNIGIRSFFFGELEVNREWFEHVSAAALTKNESKYDPDLHTMGRYEQSQVDINLLNPRYIDLLGEFRNELGELAQTARQEISEFRDTGVRRKEDLKYKEDAFLLLDKFDQYAIQAFNHLDYIEELIKSFNIQEINKLVEIKHEEMFHGYQIAIRKRERREYDDTLARLSGSSFQAVKKFFDEFENLMRNYVHPVQNELRFLGDAAIGKTHLACDITHHRLVSGYPVIFLSGDSFNQATNLETAIRNLLDIPQTYSFEMLLGALETYGSIRKTKVPIVIDGLNETIHNRYFSDIWRTHLPALSQKIKRHEHLTLVTTCRQSYSDEVWPESESRSFFHLDGFDNNEVTRDAMEKYFRKYQITTDWHFLNFYKFQKPIFLKLYCEIKNPDWQNGSEVEVNLTEDSNHDLFSSYFKQINNRISVENPFIRRGEPFIVNSLRNIARYLWENNLREIPVADFYSLIDGDRDYIQGESKADILIHEGLVISRDYRNQEEYIYITYELMAGYIIADYLVSDNDISYFLPEGPFHQKVSYDNERHPLYENLTEELALLFPDKLGTKLHRYYRREDKAWCIYSVSIECLWSMPGRFIDEEDIAEVKSAFQNEKNRKAIIELSKNTLSDVSHPLNASFLSQLLFELPVAGRDLSWTEFIRYYAYEFRIYIAAFEKECLEAIDPIRSQGKFHLVACFVQWTLTCSNRDLRDLSTRALFHYGRRFPAQLIEMAMSSLGCNDPYVPERMLAVVYGICLSEHWEVSFRDTHLRDISIRIFEKMFSRDAPYYSTHLLMRDYASKTISIGLRYFPELLSKDQVILTQPPFSRDQQLEFPVHRDGEKHLGGPIRMDFSNYTIGGIVEGGSGYDNPPDKQIVRGQIYHRIYDLGWNETDFKEIEEYVVNQNRDRYSRERPKIERYGKKYSWIGYYEIAGHRADLDLFKKDFDEYHISEVDIDPSFPKATPSPRIVVTDFLGDRGQALDDWQKSGPQPDLSRYMQYRQHDEDWVCLDGWIDQTDKKAERELFAGIRGFFVRDSDYEKTLGYLDNQDLGGRWFPEIRKNYYTFGGEMYLFPEATLPNWVNLEFETGRQTKIYKKGEPGYFPSFEIDKSDEKYQIVETYPDTVSCEEIVKDKIPALLPVMEYSWESYHTDAHRAGHTTILSAEIAINLSLEQVPQTFELEDQAGAKAVINVDYYEQYENRHRMTYLRKDLLDQFLTKNNLKLIWAIWGEREVKILEDGLGSPPAPRFQDMNKFQQVIKYEEL